MSTFAFTGPRDRMLTPRQVRALRAILRSGDVLRHGNCCGRDDHANQIAQSVGCYTIGHPSTYANLQAKSKPNEMLPPKHPLERDRDIVQSKDVVALIAAPKTIKEELQGSGTWTTIRYARRVGLPVIILEP